MATVVAGHDARTQGSVLIAYIRLLEDAERDAQGVQFARSGEQMLLRLDGAIDKRRHLCIGRDESTACGLNGCVDCLAGRLCAGKVCPCETVDVLGCYLVTVHLLILRFRHSSLLNLKDCHNR